MSGLGSKTNFLAGPPCPRELDGEGLFFVHRMPSSQPPIRLDERTPHRSVGSDEVVDTLFTAGCCTFSDIVSMNGV